MPTRAACERAAARIRHARGKKRLSREELHRLAKHRTAEALKRGEAELKAKVEAVNRQ